RVGLLGFLIFLLSGGGVVAVWVILLGLIVHVAGGVFFCGGPCLICWVRVFESYTMILLGSLLMLLGSGAAA
ncbi:hypothetical protein, partial [Herbaspirillum frisingense]|uniref:hypothetical protein n=1 Tax=Herbaspirillum frisingense TaxID=92645 RepID=UPI0039B01869